MLVYGKTGGYSTIPATAMRTNARGLSDMDFTLSEQQVALQQSVRKFAQQELPSIAKQVEESDEPPGIELRKRYAELGYLGVNLEEKYGGAGMYGKHVHQAVLAANETQSGATVHYVTAGYDEGAIIAQNQVTIAQGMTPNRLAETILKVEHPLLVQALQGLLTHHD